MRRMLWGHAARTFVMLAALVALLVPGHDTLSGQPTRTPAPTPTIADCHAPGDCGYADNATNSDH